MKTILEVINLGEEYLHKKGIERARREAEELIAEVLSLSRIALYLDFERPLTELELQKCRSFFKRRGQHEPFQYIAGSISFAGVRLKLNSDVLIPRPESEILATKIMTELSEEDLAGKILWDMCTGSGCLGISIKKKFPLLKVVLSDISEKALFIASENARDNGVDVEIYCGDMFSAVGERTFDYFVSNPPYVKEKDYIELSPEIRQFEPKQAFLAGASGLDFYEIIGSHLSRHLKRKGWLEIGADQAEEVRALFASFDGECVIEKDWSGRDRFVKLKKFF